MRGRSLLVCLAVGIAGCTAAPAPQPAPAPVAAPACAPTPTTLADGRTVLRTCARHDGCTLFRAPGSGTSLPFFVDRNGNPSRVNPGAGVCL